MAQLCVTVTAPTLAELRARRDAAAREADMVELRLDTVADPDPDGALAGRTGPVIVTCRASWEGGHFRGSEAERLRLLERAWRAGADFVDIEWQAWSRAPWIGETGGERLVVSHHDFSGVPDDLQARYSAMAATGAAVVKLAVTARALRDCVRLLDLLPPERRRHVLVGMGAAGLVPRLLPDRFGSAWTYAGDGVVPGQVPAGRMREEFRFGEVSVGAALYGLAANPAGHSVSPAMHNAAFRAAGLDAVYVPLQAVDAADLFAFADAFGLAGASVTVPFKVDVLPYCTPDAVAREVGAVNTLRRTASGWEGFNTDVAGLLAPLAGRVELAGLRATILGAGGAARAAAIALRRAGAAVTIAARRPEQAHAVAADTGTAAGPLPPPPGSWDLLVNATPVGMYPAVDQTPLPDGPFDGRLVYDLVYNPPETRLLREARAAGCATLGGLDMLVAQAVEQFRIWTGRTPDASVMRAAAERRLAAFSAAPAVAASSPGSPS